MNEAMDAEFDTVAGWTADVAIDLGPRYYLPAACRGSGSPAAMTWLLDRLGVGAQDRMLDCGAGVGGPSAFAAHKTGARMVLSDPEAGACRSAARLFGLPGVQAGSQLPFGTAAFDHLWSLGVLCTVDDQQGLLNELRRVLKPGGRLGLLVYVANRESMSQPLAGNNFPTADQLRALVRHAGFQVLDTAALGQLDSTPAEWADRAQRVENTLSARHRGDPRWETAATQSRKIGDLLHREEIIGTLLLAAPTTATSAGG